MKVVLYANSDWYLYNFRRSLIARLAARGDEVVALAPDSGYGQKLEAYGARWRPLRMDRRSVNLFAELELLVRLHRMIREEAPAVVHGFTIKGAVYGGLAALLAGVKGRILAVAGLGYVFSNSSAKARLLRPVVMSVMWLAFRGKGVRLILQNAEDAAFFRKAALLNPNHIRLIPGSGVDCDRFAPSPKRGDAIFRALLPARLLWDKGVGVFVEAAKRFKLDGKPVQFILAGTPDPGNPDSVAEADVLRWSAEGILNWEGHVDDMPALLRAVDVVVLPTKYGEGVPRSLVEAGACGLPVIATDTAGCRELITHNINGLLIPIDDVDALTRAITRLHEDPHCANRLGHAGRQRVLQKFSDDVVLADTLAVYDEVTAIRRQDTA